jgi:hypothetical protein
MSKRYFRKIQSDYNNFTVCQSGDTIRNKNIILEALVPFLYVTRIRQGGAVSRIGYVSNMDMRPIRDGYVSTEYLFFY